MQALAVALALFPIAANPREDKTVLATGDWSEPLNGLRGRLVIAQGRALGASSVRESLVYVELENVSQTQSGVLAVHFDPGSLKCDLLDAAAKSVPQTGTGGSGGRPGAVWVSLPFDSVLRVRANPFGFGRPDGLLIPLNNATWMIRAGDRNAYSLAGTLTVTPPLDHGRADAWTGVLTLAAVKLTAPTEAKP